MRKGAILFRGTRSSLFSVVAMTMILQQLHRERIAWGRSSASAEGLKGAASEVAESPGSADLWDVQGLGGSAARVYSERLGGIAPR